MRKIVLLLGVCFTIIVTVLALLGESDDDYVINIIPEYSSPECNEVQVVESPLVTTYRSWHDYNYQDFCVSYKTDEDRYDASKDLRYDFVSYEYDTDRFWGDVYRYLHLSDHDAVKELADTLYQIGIRQELDRNEFANMVVSFVQDIPYSYVLVDGDCDDQEPPYMECLEDEYLGLLSPVEFLHTLVGDCDTRTVLLYTLFKHFDYHPMIINSWVHLHSMLVLDVQAPGEYIEYKGKRYYFWETTATGWQAGEIPPGFSGNKRSWHVILD